MGYANLSRLQAAFGIYCAVDHITAFSVKERLVWLHFIYSTNTFEADPDPGLLSGQREKLFCSLLRHPFVASIWTAQISFITSKLSTGLCHELFPFMICSVNITPQYSRGTNSQTCCCPTQNFTETCIMG